MAVQIESRLEATFRTTDGNPTTLMDANMLAYYTGKKREGTDIDEIQDVQSILETLLSGSAGGGVKIEFLAEGTNPASVTGQSGYIYMLPKTRTSGSLYYEQYIVKTGTTTLVFVGNTEPDLTNVLTRSMIGGASDLVLTGNSLKLKSGILTGAYIRLDKTLHDGDDANFNHVRVETWTGNGSQESEHEFTDDLYAPVNEVLKALNDIMDGTLTE